MDDGDIEHSDKLSDNAQSSNPESSCNVQASTSMDTTNESLRKTRTCTHTHTCDSGPDAVHTHTCYHTHTQVFASEKDDKVHTKPKPKRPLGNREAVRKYREKKAQTAYLEEEVKKLHLLNQQLLRRLQKQAILEAELLRLRSILVDCKRKIDNEFGVFPYKKQCNSSATFDKGNAGRVTGLQCMTNLSCFSPHAGSSSQELVGRGERHCRPAIVDCQVNADMKASTGEETAEPVDNLISSASQAG